MLKRNWPIKFIVIGIIVIISLIRIRIIVNDKKNYSTLLPLSGAYVEWNMNADIKNKVIDSKGKHNALSFNTKAIRRLFGKAIYFNGKDSYIESSLKINGWEAITISLWVKPQYKDDNTLSVILDNGHDVNKNFVIQSADIKNPAEWVFHCNGTDIFFVLPFEQWSHLVLMANAEKGLIQLYINERKIDQKKIPPFEFGSAPITIGRLYNKEERYFKGSIDEVIIWDKAIEAQEH